MAKEKKDIEERTHGLRRALWLCVLVLFVALLWSHLASGWRTISPPGSHLSVDMPKLPRRASVDCFGTAYTTFGATPFREEYLVGFCDLTQGPLSNLSDRQLMKTMIHDQLVVKDMGEDRPATELESDMPAMESQFDWRKPQGAVYKVTKRVYVVRELSRGYVLVYAVHEQAQADRREDRDRFLSSFRIEPKPAAPND
jgi:hypothetical protein